MRNVDDDAMHFSSVMAISVADFARIKRCLADAIKQVEEIIGPSPEEILVCLNADLLRA